MVCVLHPPPNDLLVLEQFPWGLCEDQDSVLVRHWYNLRHMVQGMMGVTLSPSERPKLLSLNLVTLKEKDPGHLHLAVAPLGASAPKKAP